MAAKNIELKKFRFIYQSNFFYLLKQNKFMSLQIALENLKQQIGQEFTNGNWLTIGQDRINQFADATDDHQWIHVDPEKAKKLSPYETTIAHGYLTLSLIVPLTKPANEETQKFEGLKMAVNYGLNKSCLNDFFILLISKKLFLIIN